MPTLSQLGITQKEARQLITHLEELTELIADSIKEEPTPWTQSQKSDAILAAQISGGRLRHIAHHINTH